MNSGTTSALLPIMLGVAAGGAVLATGGMAAAPLAMMAASGAMAVGATGTQIYAANQAQSQASDVGQAQMDQAGIQAAEQKAQIKTQLEIDNNSLAERGARIREELLGVLGEQDATLASRGVSLGAGGGGAGTLASETRRRFEDDLRINRMNGIQAAADAATNTARVGNWLRGTQQQIRLGVRGQQQDLSYQRTAAIIGGASRLTDLGATFFANRASPYGVAENGRQRYRPFVRSGGPAGSERF